LLLAVLGAVALGDRETARFFEDRGDKAFRAKDWAAAEEHYRRAISEDGTYHSARFGLAETLLAAGRRDDAVAEFRAFVRDAKPLSPMPDGWGALVQRAEKRLETLDATGNELRGMVDAQCAALVAFARKWAKGDADVAAKALRRVLELKPGHAQATELLESLGRSPKGEPVALFDGAGLAGWIEASLPTWSAKDGVIEAGCRDAAYICRHERHFEGDFDVRMEARLLAEYPGAVFFALCPAYDGKDQHYSFGLFRGKFLFEEDLGTDDDRTVAEVSPANLSAKFDPKEWNVFEVRLRGKEAIALVNGEEVGRDARPEGRSGGFVGLKVQNCRVQFRKVEVVPR
jgi:tetratricopeptide (TPR) repeat protein